jgi:alpha-tubulin suppressor-like RCC1 family protein
VNRNTPTKVLEQNFKVQQITAGDSSSLILTTTGMVYAFGLNHVGQLGDGSSLSRLTPTPIVYQNKRIAKICSGSYHSLMLKGNGKIYGFGYNVVRIIDELKFIRMELLVLEMLFPDIIQLKYSMQHNLCLILLVEIFLH